MLAKLPVARAAAVLLLILGFSAPAHADSVTSGGDCPEQGAPEYDAEKHRKNIHDMALRLFEALEKNVGKVAIVSRAGSDLSGYRFRDPEKQKHTHAGVVWKHSRDGLWRFKHSLNVCAGTSSRIFVQNLVQFFNDDPHFYDIHVAAPSAGLQEKIARLLERKGAAERLHNPKYNNIANPFRTAYQNSNGWVLGVIASAQSGAGTFEEAQGHYRRAGYRPSQVRLGFLRQLGSAFMANATLEDHPLKPLGGWYDFVSAASLYRYLADTDTPPYRAEICHAAGCNVPVGTLE